ncbi:hypothetical protein HpMS107_02610 [Helicobacter pylori]
MTETVCRGSLQVRQIAALVRMEERVDPHGIPSERSLGREWSLNAQRRYDAAFRPIANALLPRFGTA